MNKTNLGRAVVAFTALIAVALGASWILSKDPLPRNNAAGGAGLTEQASALMTPSADPVEAAEAAMAAETVTEPDPGANETIDVEQAKVAVVEFVSHWGMSLDPGSLRQGGLTMSEELYPDQIALVNDEYTAIVGGPNLKVIYFDNRKRNEDRFKQRDRTGQLRFGDENAMRQYIEPRVHQLASDWAFSPVLTRMEWWADNTPGKGDSNRGGVIFAHYGVRPEGRPVFAGLTRMQITLDPQDGILLSYHYANVMEIEANQLVITESAARTAARALAQIHAPSAGAVVEARLGYRWPNGSFGSVRRYVENRQPRVRLAWAVGFANSGTVIFIDAATGESLGGSFMRTASPVKLH